VLFGLPLKVFKLSEFRGSGKVFLFEWSERKKERLKSISEVSSSNGKFPPQTLAFSLQKEYS
jgi:hypothetical protein